MGLSQIGAGGNFMGDNMTIKQKPLCVYVMKRNGEPYRWMVRTIVRGDVIYLGCYDTREKAIQAWNRYAEKNGRELNNPEALGVES